MRAINTVTLLLLIIGGLNWGLVGLSALYQIVPLIKAGDQPSPVRS